MRRGLKIRASLLALALFAGGSIYVKVDAVKAAQTEIAAADEGAVVAAAELSKIRVEIDEKNNVILHTEALNPEELRTVMYKAGTSNWTPLHVEPRSGEVRLTKEEVKTELSFKKGNHNALRTVHFAEQPAILQETISTDEEMTEIRLQAEGAEYRVFDSRNQGGEWHEVTETSFPIGYYGGESSKEFEIRKKANQDRNDHFVFASASTRYTANRLQRLKNNISKVTFEAKGEASGELQHVDENMEFSINGQRSWDRVKSSDGARKYIGGGISEEHGIVIRYYNNHETQENLQVERHPIALYQNRIKQNLNVFTEVPEGFEVVKDGRGNWEKVKNGTYTAKEMGTYRFRMGASGIKLASKEAESLNYTVLKLTNSPKIGGGQIRGDGQIGGGNFGGGQIGGGQIDGGGGQIGGGNFGGGQIGGGAAIPEKEEKEAAKTEEKKEESQTRKEEEKREASPVSKKEVTGEKEENQKALSVTVTAALFDEKEEAEIKVNGEGRGSYVLKVKKADLQAGNKVKVYEEKAGKLTMVDAKSYIAKEEGLRLSLASDKTYVVLNEKEAEDLEKKIVENLKLRKKKLTLKDGKLGAILFKKAFATENVKKVRYFYNKKELSVSKTGKIKAKGAKGSAFVIVSVTLKNHVTKKMKLKVIKG